MQRCIQCCGNRETMKTEKRDLARVMETVFKLPSVSHFFLVFLFSGYSPIGTKDVNVGFDYELAQEAEDAGTASETES